MYTEYHRLLGRRANLGRNTCCGSPAATHREPACAEITLHKALLPRCLRLLAEKSLIPQPITNVILLDGHARRRTLSTRRRVTAGPDGGALVLLVLQ